MNKPKFTEGPWLIDDSYSTFIDIRVVEGEADIAQIDIDTEYNETGPNKAAPTEEQYANAHLIKTSPLLYAEIESDILEIKLNMSFIKFDDDALPILKDALARKETLLAEARGEK